MYSIEALNKEQRIGFTEAFPPIEGTEVWKQNYRHSDIQDSIEFSVQRCSFDKYSCWSLRSSRAELRDRGPLGGFGSHSYSKEADILTSFAEKFAIQHGLSICQVSCNWPFFNAIIQKTKNSEDEIISYFQREKLRYIGELTLSEEELDKIEENKVLSSKQNRIAMKISSDRAKLKMEELKLNW